jgi:hypothetical protein
MSYIRAVCDSREWDGKPHVTALLTGTREQYLKHVSKWTVDLDGMAMAVAGTRLHSNLEEKADIGELKVSMDDVQGSLDLLEEDVDGSLMIVDYKLVGSFKLKKWIGMSSRLIPVLDAYGNPVYLKSGPNKGKPKMTSEKCIDPDSVDRFDYTMQTNIYRVALERLLANEEFIKANPKYAEHADKKIDKIRIFFVLRDGSIAHDFSFNTSFEEVEILPDNNVLEFINVQANDLVDAINSWEKDKEAHPDENPMVLAKRNCPRKCSSRETWNGKKCENYCPVYTACLRMD